MGVEEENDGGATRGFAGLSALISDVDAEIAKAKEAVEHRPASPITSDIRSDSGSLYQSSGGKISHEPNQQPPSEPNFVLVDKPYFGGSSRGKSEGPETGSEKAESPIRELWKGMLAIGATVSIIWVLVYVSVNKYTPVSVRTSTPSNVPARQPQRAEPTQDTSVPKPEKSVYDSPFAKKLRNAELNLGLALELRPPVGTDNKLNEAQIRYCLSEKIRIDGAKSSVNLYIPAEVDRFNATVADFNSRCAEFSCQRSTMESIQLEVDSKRSTLLADGAGRFQNIQGSEPPSEPTLNYPNDRQHAGQSSTAPESESVKRSIYNYYELIQRKDVDGAMKCYSADKLPLIKKSRIAAIAKDTEYYKIENINVLFTEEANKAKAITSLVHKKYGLQPELWEITLELIKEAGEWKICATPGHKMNQ